MVHTIHSVFKSVLAFYFAVILVGCTPTTMQQPTLAPKPAGQIANPASENCVKHGGTLAIYKRGDSSESGVCLFEDNRQCEEWAYSAANAQSVDSKLTAISLRQPGTVPSPGVSIGSQATATPARNRERELSRTAKLVMCGNIFPENAAPIPRRDNHLMTTPLPIALPWAPLTRRMDHTMEPGYRILLLRA